MKWYTGQVSENSEICYHQGQNQGADLLAGYINKHGGREIKELFSRLNSMKETRIQAALDDIRSRVALFDSSKSVEDLHVFMRYLESRLRDLTNKNLSLTGPSQRRISNVTPMNGYDTPRVDPDFGSNKSRTNSGTTSLPRQYGRQHHRSSGNLERGESINGHPPQTLPRRISQTSQNQGETLLSRQISKFVFTFF